MNWKVWPMLYWLFWGIAFIVWETYGGIEKMGQRDIPMLTQVTVRYVPWWITMPFLTWLFIHFALRYANPHYIQSLGGK